MTGPVGAVGLGLIGAGDVSAQYLESLLGYPDVAVVGVADLDVERPGRWHPRTASGSAARWLTLRGRT
jgi:hypothetical protein